MALNFADLFEHAADAVAERTAVACGDRRVTYRELEERANRLAHHLAGIGVGPGDHVGLYARNSIEAIETLVAACKLRAAAVNINYRYVENELRYMFADSDLTALVYDRRLAPVVAAAAPAAPGLRGLVEIDDASQAQASQAQASRRRRRPAAAADHAETAYEEALAAASPERDFPARSGDDVYIIYTGGTTGYPKGVMWRHEDIWRTLAGGMDFITGEPLPDEWAQSRKGLDTGEFVKLCAAPLIHGNAQVAALAGLFTGETIVMLPAFDPNEIWRAIERHQRQRAGDHRRRDGPAAGRVVPGRGVRRLLAGRRLLQRGTVLPGGQGRLRQGAARRRHHRGDRLHRDRLRRDQLRQRRRPAPRRPDRDGRPGRHRARRQQPARAPGQVGRLARGGHVPLGYYKDAERTAAMFAEVNGKRYAVPGDMARVEEDGTVTLLGRGNTCVNSGGEKVFPEEVEGALKSHPDVFDALVIGVPDDLLGQRVAALVQLRPGAAPDPAALQAHVRDQIAGYKVPRSIWLTDAIRRTVSGKADYGWAREYAAAHAPASVPR